MKFKSQVISLALSLSSIMLNILVIFYLIERNTSYSQLMRKIIIFECLLLYSRSFSIWVNTDEDGDLFRSLLERFAKVINFFLFKSSDQLYTDFLERINNAFSLSSECVLFLFNSFLCYELIRSIKHPISQTKNRIILYDLIGFSSSAVLILYYVSELKGKDIHFSIFTVGLFATLALFLAFVVMGVLSIIFLVIHFTKEKNETHSARKLFVMKHSLYVLVYLCIFSYTLGTSSYTLIKVKFDLKKYIDEYENGVLLKIASYCTLSIGIILFPIRLLETQLIWTCPCIKRQSVVSYNPDADNKNKTSLLSAFITRNINIEMICCILYGMNKMFRAKDGRNSINEGESFSRSSSLDEEKRMLSESLVEAKAHTIKYKQIFNLNRGIFRKDALKQTMSSKTESQGMNYTEDESYLLKSFDLKDIQIISKDNDAIMIEYHPYIFSILRSEDDISNEMIKESLNPDNNMDFLQSLVESKGRSGSFFFFSSDNKFIIKTMSSAELKTISKGFLIDYYNHIINNPDTLIAKIYGIYTVVINEISTIHVILMQNLVNCKSDYVKHVFDIKGSTFQRKTDHFAERSSLSPLKDLDFLWMKRVNENLVSIGDDVYNEILTRIEIDTAMLKNNNLMDYSLLFVIIELPDEKDENYLEIIGLLGDRRYLSKTFKGKKVNYMYVLGIIDYLQEFNYFKSLELKCKSLLYWKDKNNVSVQPPEEYARRFVDFICNNFK